jgi:acetoacetate decarboxylase
MAGMQREIAMAFVKTPEEMRRLMAGREHPEFYGAEMLFVFWETKPDIVARLLPPPLEPTPLPLASALVAYYPRTNFGAAYHEGALCLWAQFQGVPGNYCLAMPVTDDMAMAGGREGYGYPKKMARIEFDKRAGDVSGRISRRGQTFFEVGAHLSPGSVEESMRSTIANGLAFGSEAGSPMYLFKHFPLPGTLGFDYPPRLIRQNNVFRARSMEWADVEISMPRCEDDPWHEVEVVRVLGGAYVVGDNTMLPGETVAEVDPVAFAPYSWERWDPAQMRLPAERAAVGQGRAA